MSSAAPVTSPRRHSGEDRVTVVIEPVSEVTVEMRGRVSGRMSSVPSTRFSRHW